MKKRSLVCTLAILTAIAVPAYAATAPFGYDLQKDINRTENAKRIQQQQERQQAQSAAKTLAPSTTDKAGVYYPKATLSSAISKYKAGNYAQCLQELQSYVKKDPSNPLAYYYLGMAYTQVGNKDEAVKSYEKAIELSPNDPVATYATKGKDCLTGGPACKPAETAAADSKGGSADDAKLDQFIQAPYGSGMTPELEQQMKKEELERLQKRMNTTNELKTPELERIKNLDNQSQADTSKLASADVSDKEILKAIKTLREAGMTVNIQPAGQTQAIQPVQNAIPGFNPMDPEFIKSQQQFQEMSMLLGNKNNNNNNNNLMNMLPYMMNQGQNMNPQMIQAFMMNNMLPDFTMDMNNDK